MKTLKKDHIKKKNLEKILNTFENHSRKSNEMMHLIFIPLQSFYKSSAILVTMYMEGQSSQSRQMNIPDELLFGIKSESLNYQKARHNNLIVIMSVYCW